MIILEHSTYDGDSIGRNLGSAEYSYWFVRKAFRPLLERFGIVIPVSHPEREADRIYRAAKRYGIPCVLMSFNPPHRTVMGLECPTVPVFAWEFDRIPDEAWGNEPRNNWAAVLSQLPVAITHSQSSVAAVRNSLGPAYPVWSIPAPVKDGIFSNVASARGWRDPIFIELNAGVAIDAGGIDLSLFHFTRANTHGARALRLLEIAAIRPDRHQRLDLSGVIYSSVFNTADGRKNWTDMVSAFVVAFRDTPDATLILKTTHYDITESVLPILIDLAILGSFKCRVIIIHGLLSDDAYARLIEATSFTVNTSHGEGQCLPLMEFMAAGRPAVTPHHTAMLDYVSDENAFVVDTHLRLGFWPHDARQAKRCMRHEINFADLVRQYRASYSVAVHEPARYERMVQAASKALDAFCSDAVTTTRMAQVMRHLGLAQQIVPFSQAVPESRAV